MMRRREWLLGAAVASATAGCAPTAGLLAEPRAAGSAPLAGLDATAQAELVRRGEGRACSHYFCQCEGFPRCANLGARRRQGRGLG